MACKLKLVRGSIISCLRDPENNNITLPHKYRYQRDIHDGSCIQHALATTLDILQYQKLKWNNLPLDKFNVDVGFLIREYPPPYVAEDILKHIIKERKGLIRAENEQYPFQLASYTKYLIDRGQDEEGEKALNQFVKDFSIRKAPGVGLFGLRTDNIPKVGEIFVGNGTGKVDCRGCKTKIPQRHAVCVTGFGWAKSPNDGNIVRIFQYLDSDRPRRPHYMTATSLKSIIVPHLKPEQETPDQEP